MNENYTAEDFARANVAMRSTDGVARRVAPESDKPWRASWIPDFDWLSDEDMAADGWVPVVEATEVMQNRQIDAEAHLDQIERLSKRLAAAGDQIESQRIVIEDLREENYRLESSLQAPLSLDSLRAAWEAAEQADECREGDVLMTRHSDDNYEVWVSAGALDISKKSRILSRAPREPWQDLADVLGDFAIHDTDGKEHPDVLARLLHVRGVRVTGGEES